MTDTPTEKREVRKDIPESVWADARFWADTKRTAWGYVAEGVEVGWDAALAQSEAQIAELEAERDVAKDLLNAALRTALARIAAVRALCDGQEAHCSAERLDTPSWVASVRAALDTTTEAGE